MKSSPLSLEGLTAAFRLGFGLAAALAFGVSAQPLSNSVFTVGTTIQSGGAHRSYVLVGTPQPALLAGKHFAVYAKPDYATNPGTFTLRGTMAQQTDAPSINALLNSSVALGQDLVGLSNTLNVLLYYVPGISNQTLAQKVLTAFQIGAGNPELAQTLRFAGRVNPGLNQCLGVAFSEQITSVTTYELREAGPTGSHGDVVGRVTVRPGFPVVLPAPGYPYQVVANEPEEHLRVRLRWATSPEWRRVSLLGAGFNVWRTSRANAEARGYHVTPPTLAALYGGDPGIARANWGPVSASKHFAMGSGPGAADDPADETTYFFVDDNRRADGDPFTDGAEFYYFVTARDVLGRDGLVGQGRLARSCRRIPPGAPTGLQVLNEFKPTEQRLALTWLQDLEPTNAVTAYWVYRWPNPAHVFAGDAAPLSNRVGVVAHAVGTNRNYFVDTSAGAPSSPGLSNWWYTVRSVSAAACADLLSPHSPPAWGVVRERSGPNGTTGEVVGSCGTPAVAFQSFNLVTNGTLSFDFNYRLTCRRRDRGIAYVEFTVTNYAAGYPSVESFGPLYFPPDGDVATADFSVLRTASPAPVDVRCVVGTAYGLASQEARYSFQPGMPYDVRHEAVFSAGQLLLTSLSSSDPLLVAVNNGQLFCIPPYEQTADPSGMVRLRFDPQALSGPVLIRAQDQEHGATGWKDVAVVSPDAQGAYWFYFPSCLVGPLPAFLGCRVQMPAEGDCSQHMTSGSAEAGVAPIRVRFRLQPRTREYRVYRQVNGGTLSMIAQGAAAYDATRPDKLMERVDDAMPSTAAQLCYFVQLLDEHGNGGPMSILGCKEAKPPQLARPVLAEPRAIGDAANPQVSLSWFCPTAGVHRFQVKIARADKPASGEETGVTGPRLKKLSGALTNPRSRYLGLISVSGVATRFDETQLTPPVGADFGPGPQFTLTATVLPNVPYLISVAPLDRQDKGGDGSLSQVWPFTWKPPVAVQTVPWPARPLPPVKGFNEDGPTLHVVPFAGLVLSPQYQVDPRYPVGIAIGAFVGDPFQVSYNAGTTNLLTWNSSARLALGSRLSADPSKHGEPLLPIVVYRQQLTNNLFPRVSGHLVQVSPLIERIATTFYPFGDTGGYSVAEDQLIVGGFANVIWSEAPSPYVFLRDQQPVIRGARYEYLVVRLNAKREIEEIIPAGMVEVPANL